MDCSCCQAWTWVHLCMWSLQALALCPGHRFCMDKHLLFPLSEQGLSDLRSRVGRIRCFYNKINKSSAQVLLCVSEIDSSFHTRLLFILEVCYADKLGLWWLFIAKAESCYVLENPPVFLKVSAWFVLRGYSWLWISPASVSISSQQQCLQEAFGLSFLGSGVFLVWVVVFFLISSALKLLGAKSQSSWKREGRLYMQEMLMGRYKWEGAGGVEGRQPLIPELVSCAWDLH